MYIENTRKDITVAIYYFIVLGLMGLGYVLTERRREPKWTVCYLTVSCLVLTFFASFRYAIGFDYFSYRNIYKMMEEWTFGDIFSVYWHEPLFYILCKLSCLLGCSFFVFLSGINLFLFFAAMRFIYLESKMPWVSVGLYILLQFFAYNMNLIRQSIALAFFLFAYPYLKNRRVVWFGIFMFIGGLFHNSLWLMMPFYVLLNQEWSGKYLGIVAAAAGGIYEFCDWILEILLPFLPEKYGNYLETYFWNSNGMVYAMPGLIYLGILYGFRKRIREPLLRRIYLNSALYYFLISLFITKHFILERFSVYPFILSILALPEVIASDSYRSYQEKGEREEKQDKRYGWVLGICLGLAGGYFFFAVWKGFHHVYPYVSLLQRGYSLPDR